MKTAVAFRSFIFPCLMENIAKKAARPWISFGSDGGSKAPEGVFLNQSTHPRGYGNFARVFAKYVREEQALTIAEAVRKLTSFPASNLKLKDRGRLAPRRVRRCCRVRSKHDSGSCNVRRTPPIGERRPPMYSSTAFIRLKTARIRASKRAGWFEVRGGRDGALTNEHVASGR